ncbi:MAG: cobalamin biosynthesis protein [Dehalococcoidales bacterium]|nr:cobalamin biosynthesis protein [Dehalococcoidales bacterium]
MEALLIFGLALVLDLAFGEPPNYIHPVFWMGKVISLFFRGSNRYSHRLQFIYGIVIFMLTMVLFTAVVFFLLWFLRGLNPVAYIVVAGLILKTTFSLNGLRRTALKIKSLLKADKLAGAKFELRALVGRDTSRLEKPQLVSATVESVAESSCDSFFAPLFYFLFFGVPGAVCYRVINTLDSMVGHHGEYEYTGKFSAWSDTVVNYIPARIAAVFIVFASWVFRAKAGQAWRIMRRDCKNTKSPNAGWTMSAVAGALDVQLEKVGYYKLGDANTPLVVQTIDKSLKIVITASLFWSLILILIEVAYYAAT